MTDPRQIIAQQGMTRFQWIAVAITVGLNALDGFDVLAISFASPGIAAEWGIDRAALGIVLSMELIGMALGSIFLGGVADRIGRRPTMLGCLVVMAAGMLLATTTSNIYSLSAWRVMTGLGIGGMLAAINAAAAEYSNAKSRNLAVSLMAVGYPVGAVIGGSVAAVLLQYYDWRSVFLFGAAVTGIFIPLVWWRLPETIAWLCQKRPAGALEKANRTLARMGHEAAATMPPPEPVSDRTPLAALFAPGMAGTTILVTFAYFLHITTFYFIIKWIPKLVVDMGFAPSAAAGVLVWANVGGALGGATLGLLTVRFGVKPMTITVLLLAFVMVVIFGQGQSDLAQLSLVTAMAGFFTNAGIVGLYAIFAQAFPTSVRAGGTGFAIGVGRGGAALAPITAGFLFQAGYSLQTVATFMACGALVAAVVLLRLKLRGAEE